MAPRLYWASASPARAWAGSLVRAAIASNPDTRDVEITVKAENGVVTVVGKAKTQEAIDSIGREIILGVVFNASSESLKSYGYYYRYYQQGQRS